MIEMMRKYRGSGIAVMPTKTAIATRDVASINSIAERAFYSPNAKLSYPDQASKLWSDVDRMGDGRGKVTHGG